MQQQIRLGQQAARQRSGRFRKAVLVLAALAVGLPIAMLAGFRGAAAVREADRASDLAPASGRFVEIATGRLFVQEKGPSDGHPVLLIHGTGAWSELWRPTIDHLAGRGFRVIALDMPPFGFSDRPATPSYGRSDQAQRILGLLDALGVESAYLVGHSFGAGPTVEAVLRSPARVRGLVLVAGALGLSGKPEEAGGFVAWIMDRVWLRDTIVAASATNPLMTQYLLSTMLHRKERADRHAVAILQRPMTLANSTRDLGIWLEHFLSPPADGAALSADRKRYADITVPTALIWGNKDSLTPLDQGRALHGLVKGSTLIVMPDVGHIPQLEDPTAFNRLLSDALRSMMHR